MPTSRQTMIRHSTAALLVAIAARAASAQATQPAITLHVGDAAPTIQVASWAKGTPVGAFEPGRVYVVEFWATWCVPCKKAIPHLTELSKRYADRATFVGVDVLEHVKPETDEAVIAKVMPFVESMGGKMDYHVAVDGIAGRMLATWFEAAGQQGIPATFVVDGQGRLAWIGHPDLLEPVLQQVIAGTWDAAAERTRAADQEAAEAPARAANAAIMAAFRKHDDVAVVAACDAAVSTVPALATDTSIVSYRMQALFNSDAAKAVEYVRQATGPAGAIHAPAEAWALIRVVPKVAPTSPMTADDWKAVVACVEPLIATGEAPSGSLYADYAALLGKANDRDGAIAYLRKSVDLTAADNAKRVDDGHADYYKALLKERQDRLAALLAGAGQADVAH